ncbi:unnamed protein product [Rhodiola kirilowii]
MEGATGEAPLVTDPPEKLDIFGDPKIVLRIGDDYQGKIPSLVSDDDWHNVNHNDVNITNGVSSVHLMGLPTPLEWTKQNSERTSQVTDQYCDKIDFNSGSPLFEELDNSSRHPDLSGNRGKGHYLVSGSEDKQWSEIEEAGFLLGLYIFGKNFVLLKKFVGKESMGGIIAFYYGKFYQSGQYRRWSESRINKSRKCVYGHKIFTGSRQKEFVSRLLANVAEDLQADLLEVSKTYAMGNISIEKYVFNLKALVGMERLINAVAIGKGKRDLTCPSANISKSNQALNAYLDVPAGKAWSSLTNSAIINFLTKEIRLCKAKSIDLFWEAVWPRLLARGWHSEQPKGYAYVSGSKQSLVFLVPGVKKFSRRKLVRGEDYFDSVFEILNKIAKEPMLLDHEVQTGQGSNIKVTVAAKLDDVMEHRDLVVVDGHANYLKPVDPSPEIEYVGLTVIDTTLATAVTGKAQKVTYWPVKTLNMSSSRSQFEEIENKYIKEPREESDSGDTCCLEQNASSKSKALNVDHIYLRRHTVGQVYASLPNSITLDMANRTISEDQVRREKSRSKRGADSNSLVDDTPLAIKKLKKPTVFSHQGTGQRSITYLLNDISKQSEDGESYHNLNSTVTGISQMKSSQEELVPEVCSPKPLSKNDTRTNRVSLKNEFSLDEPRPRMVIDLNLPYNSDNDLDGAPGIEISSPEQGPAVNSRRHSTRNRPLTAKVLDAIADGLFEVEPKRKRWQSSSANCKARLSQQDRAASNGILNIEFRARKLHMQGNGESGANSNNNMVRNLQPQPMGDSSFYMQQLYF